jgi:hypothetical protein
LPRERPSLSCNFLSSFRSMASMSYVVLGMMR